VDVVAIAHLVGKGRSAKVPERYASSEHLMAALCSVRTWRDRRGCHELLDANELPDELRGLRILGLLALCTAYKVDPPEWADTDPLGALRAVCSALSGEAA